MGLNATELNQLSGQVKTIRVTVVLATFVIF